MDAFNLCRELFDVRLSEGGFAECRITFPERIVAQKEEQLRNKGVS